MKVRRAEVPPVAILDRFRQGPKASATYIDCFTVDVPADVSLARFVEVFYTTPVFKAERVVLKLAAHSSTDDEAKQLAHGETDTFAAWTVLDRSETELLMRDVTHRTLSWFRVLKDDDRERESTRLDFGTVVTPKRRRNGTDWTIGAAFKATLGLHQFYSRILLAAAAGRVT